MGFKGDLSFDIWIDIQGCVNMVLVILKVPGEDLEWSGNLTQKLFSWMSHSSLVVGIIIIEFLYEFLHLEEHRFGFIGHMINYEGNGINDVVGVIFEHFIGFNRIVGGYRGFIIDGGSRRDIKSGH